MTENRPESPLTRGSNAHRENRLDVAKDAFTEAVALYRKSSNPKLLAMAITELGKVERDLGNRPAAVAHYEEVVSIYRSGPDPLILAHAIRHIADILREDGKLEEAAPHYKESLEIYCAHADSSPLDMANAIRGFALLKGEIGEVDDAKVLWQEARDLYAGVDVPAGVAESDAQLALLRSKSD